MFWISLCCWVKKYSAHMEKTLGKNLIYQLPDKMPSAKRCVLNKLWFFGSDWSPNQIIELQRSCIYTSHPWSVDENIPRLLKRQQRLILVTRLNYRASIIPQKLDTICDMFLIFFVSPQIFSFKKISWMMLDKCSKELKLQAQINAW